MSSHPIPSPTSDVQDSIRWDRAMHAQRLSVAYIGREPTITDDGTDLALVFDPDLTTEETETLDSIVIITGFGRVTPAEVDAIRPDVALMKQYLAASAPTAAQTAAATKAIIRVIRAVFTG